MSIHLKKTHPHNLIRQIAADVLGGFHMDGFKSDKSETPRKRRRARYTLPIVLAAIKGSGGIVQTVALALQCDWHTARRYINRWKKTREFFQGELNQILDLAESRLVEAVKRDESWAIKFLLSTKGKHRGYSLRMEHSGESGSHIQVRFVAPKLFDTAEEWQRYVDRRPSESAESSLKISRFPRKAEETQGEMG